MQTAAVDITELKFGATDINFSACVSILDVTVDNPLTMAGHVAIIRRPCFFQLRQLKTIRSSLSMDAATKLVYAMSIGLLQ